MKCLLLAYVWPEPRSSAAGLRSRTLIEMLQIRGWEVIVASAAQSHTAQAQESLHPRAELEEMGVACHAIELNSDRFDHWIHEIQPDLVIFDRFVTEEQFSWRVRRVCPNAIRVLDSQDLHFLRRARARALQSGMSIADLAAGKMSLEHEDTHRELAAIYRCDLTLVISSYEYQLLKDQFQISPDLLLLHRLSYPRQDEASKKSRPSFDERRDCIMLGNFRHPPNADSLRWLRYEVWPLIHRLLPNVDCHVYGAYPPKEAMQMGDAQLRFKVKGWVADHHHVLRTYRLNLAALRFGAGIKGKITDGWLNGIPVIATEIAAEGMTDHYPFGGKISNDAFGFAQQVAELYLNQGLWIGSQKNGDQLIQQLYSFTRNANDLLQRLTELRHRLPEHRRQNVMGGMLWLQSNRSVEYFSKWIQLKNESAHSTRQ